MGGEDGGTEESKVKCQHRRTHGFNQTEQLGWHKGRNGITGCILCRDECESVVHVLWECPAYNDSREEFVVKLRAV